MTKELPCCRFRDGSWGESWVSELLAAEENKVWNFGRKLGSRKPRNWSLESPPPSIHQVSLLSISDGWPGCISAFGKPEEEKTFFTRCILQILCLERI